MLRSSLHTQAIHMYMHICTSVPMYIQTHMHPKQTYKQAKLSWIPQLAQAAHHTTTLALGPPSGSIDAIEKSGQDT